VGERGGFTQLNTILSIVLSGQKIGGEHLAHGQPFDRQHMGTFKSLVSPESTLRATP
jgi:hypothetical protein